MDVQEQEAKNIFENYIYIYKTHYYCKKIDVIAHESLEFWL